MGGGLIILYLDNWIELDRIVGWLDHWLSLTDKFPWFDQVSVARCCGEGVDDFSPSMFAITLSHAQTHSFQIKLGIHESNPQIFKFSASKLKKETVVVYLFVPTHRFRPCLLLQKVQKTNDSWLGLRFESPGDPGVSGGVDQNKILGRSSQLGSGVQCDIIPLVSGRSRVSPVRIGVRGEPGMLGNWEGLKVGILCVTIS